MIQPKGWKKIIEFGAVEKSAALPFFNAKSSASFMEGGERYGIPSGKKRQTAWHLPENAV